MSEPMSTPAEPAASRRDPWWARFATPAWRRSLVHLAVLLGVAIAASYAISPGLYSQQLPQLRAEDVGKPFKSPSPSGFKASRDYQIADETLTALRRQEARAAVRPVY